ncbi:unnamed protein product [Acidithrix sp. C25]|nr:unnamed protein product [Acidithrix sp. C25]
MPSPKGSTPLIGAFVGASVEAGLLNGPLEVVAGASVETGVRLCPPVVAEVEDTPALPQLARIAPNSNEPELRSTIELL